MKVNIGLFSGTAIPLLLCAEQKLIVAEVELRLSVVDVLYATADLQCTTMVRQGDLQNAVAGGLQI